MNYKQLFLLLLCIFWTNWLFAQWEVYQSEYGNFTLLLPNEPIAKDAAKEGFMKSNSNGIHYEVRYMENPKDKGIKASKHLTHVHTEKYLHQLKKNGKIKVEDSKELKMMGLNAKETQLQFEGRGNLTKIIYRIFISHQYIYEFISESIRRLIISPRWKFSMKAENPPNWVKKSLISPSSTWT